MEADQPWEALNLGDSDSDIPSLLRPCKRKSTESTRPSPNRIPGPAGAVHAAMLSKLQNNINSFCIGKEPLTTQEYVRRAVLDSDVDDGDFSRDPWLFALEFIRREGLAVDGGTIGTPLSLIKTEPKLGNRKVAQVVAIIKSCTPNGLGDLMVTLKDPTGTIDASMHRKVLIEGGFANNITVGTVLILQKVSVFSSPLSVRYLNITLNNIVKAIPKDTKSLSEQNHKSRVISTAHAIGNTKQTWNRQKVSSLLPDRNANIINSLRQTCYMRGRVLNDKGVGGDEALGQHIGGRMKNAAVLDVTNELVENVVVEKMPSPQDSTERDDHLKSSHSSDDSNLFGFSKKWESVTIDEGKKQRKVPISRGSLPQWTDEQLDELCSFD
ncbi:putative Cysteine-rich RLK (RECEPTOR-like protein kinase) 8 [Hibiscus syriacus]|uniref:Cysteine-rich RLK (RECEPTOR-like protein kinase) 8 n=2 Tax=Hibiscus syriacus TaxID=106335 RepID=A0A6A3B5Y0_HIBSY|nr:putative Cysteine-rich RLK (RECEPTOR-like protein kinase) 8 [Hibiscus syriacus]